jgi:hypothetical protein
MDKVLGIFGPKKQEVIGGWGECRGVMRGFKICTFHEILLG